MKIQPGAIPPKTQAPQPKEMKAGQKGFALKQTPEMPGTGKSKAASRAVHMQSPQQLQAGRAPDLKQVADNLLALRNNPSRGPGGLRMALEPLQGRAHDLKLLVRELAKNPSREAQLSKASGIYHKLVQEMRDLPLHYHQADPERRAHLLKVSADAVAQLDGQAQGLFKELKVDGQGTFDAKLSGEDRSAIARAARPVGGDSATSPASVQDAVLKGDVKISEDGREMAFSLKDNEKIVSVIVARGENGRFSVSSAESILLKPVDTDVI